MVHRGPGKQGGLCSPCALTEGTGKTVVGLHIIFWLCQSHQEQESTRSHPGRAGQPGGPRILYCGPSNKSVDIMAGVLGMVHGAARGCLHWRDSLSSHPTCPQDCS